MTNTLIQLTEAEFDARFPLVTNHLNPHASWTFDGSRGCLFETFWRRAGFCTATGILRIFGLWLTARMATCTNQWLPLRKSHWYLVSTVPVPDGSDIQVHIPVDADDTTLSDVMESSLANVPLMTARFSPCSPAFMKLPSSGASRTYWKFARPRRGSSMEGTQEVQPCS